MVNERVSSDVGVIEHLLKIRGYFKFLLSLR